MLEQGIRVDSIQNQVEAAFNAASDTSEDGVLNRYKRWMGFWGSRSSSGGHNTSSNSYYLKALSDFPQYEYCSGNGNQAGSDWQLIGPIKDLIINGTPRQNMGIVSAVAINMSNQNVMYVGTSSSGIWKTTNGQSANPQWANVTDSYDFPNLGITDIKIDPNNSDIVYASTFHGGRGGYGAGIIKSVNAGVTWVPTDLNFDPVNAINFEELLIDPTNTNRILTVSEDELYLSGDGGATWPGLGFPATATSPSPNFDDIDFNYNSFDEVYVSGEQIWKYKISTQTWTRLDILPSFTVPTSPWPGASLSRIDASISGQNDGFYAIIKFVYSNDCKQFRLRKYDDATNTWVSDLTPNKWAPIFIVSRANPNVMYLGHNTKFIACNTYVPCCTINKSIDGGNVFDEISYYSSSYYGVYTHADIRDLELFSGSANGESDILMAGTDGGVLYTASAQVGGSPVNWQNKNGTGLAITEFYGLGG